MEVHTLLKEDITIYYPSKNGSGIYETIPCSFVGCIGSYSHGEDVVNFIKQCYLTKEECDNACKRMNQEKELSIEIPFGAYDSELIHHEWTIPEGYTAEIKDGKVIVNKVRFKVGDVVHNTNYHGSPLYKIVNIDAHCYICEAINGEDFGDKAIMHFTFDNPYLQPWKMYEAHDGDILFGGITTIIYKNHDNGGIWSYCDYQIDNKFHNTKSFWGDDNWKPATKEQRDLLFSKMDEAGYEWNEEEYVLLPKNASPHAKDFIVQQAKKDICKNCSNEKFCVDGEDCQILKKNVPETDFGKIPQDADNQDSSREELTEFEQALYDYLYDFGDISDHYYEIAEEVRKIAPKLLAIAREQIASEIDIIEMTKELRLSELPALTLGFAFAKGVENTVKKIQGL